MKTPKQNLTADFADGPDKPSADSVSPSPGGEGRDEGGEDIRIMAYDKSSSAFFEIQPWQKPVIAAVSNPVIKRIVIALCLCASVSLFSACATKAKDDFTLRESAAAKADEFTGYVESAYFAMRSKGQPTFLNLVCPERGVHAASTSADQSTRKRSEDRAPKRDLTVVIWGIDRARFPDAPEKRYLRKTIRVRGKLGSYRGKPQMEVTTPKQITERTTL